MQSLSKYFSKLATLYLMVALVVPAMIPAGYMISRDATSNVVEITICSAINHRQVLLDLDSGRILNDATGQLQLPEATAQPDSIPGDQNESGLEICPFGLASALLLVSVPAEFPGFQSFSSITSAIPTSVVNHQSVPPLPARGPPILV